MSKAISLFLVDTRACYMKITIDGNSHGNRAQQPIKIKVSVVVTRDGKVIINGKF